MIKLVEIMASGIEVALKELGIVGKMTYITKSEEIKYLFGDSLEVWELSDEEFKKLCTVSDEDWKDEWGCWRQANGSNLGSVNHRYNINGHYIYAWDGVGREDLEIENRGLPVCDRYPPDLRKYESVTEYILNEIGTSTERNTCAIATDLAAQNMMKLSELFKKYQKE